MNYNVTHYKMEICHLVDMYTTYSSTLVTSDFYFINNDKTGAPRFVRKHVDGVVIGKYKEIIVLGHTSALVYGHWIHDFLAPLALIPEEIVRRAHILFHRGYSETLEAFGFKKDRIIQVKKGEWVYGEHIYTATDPVCYISHYGISMQRLGNILAKHYKIENIVPSKYCFTNRDGVIARNANDCHTAFSARRGNCGNG